MNIKKENKPGLPGILNKYIKRLAEMRFFQQRNFFTFLFFVVVAAIFWFSRSLSEQYEADVTYPVRYINFPDNKVLLGKVPDKLQLKVRAKGFSILRSKLNLNLIPIKFNVNSFSLNSIGNDTFYVVTETVKDLLSAELDEITILDIYPDTLFFRFTDIAIKRVAVTPLLVRHNKFFQQQFMQNGTINVFPDSIIISGPATIIRTIDHVLTEPLNFTNLSDTIQIQCNLQQHDRITFSQEKVQVTIPVDKFTEVQENLTVVPYNVPDSLTMIAIPGKVSIIYRICLSNYKKMASFQLSPGIDYEAIRNTNLSRLTVFLADTPGIITNIRFNPKETEYLITRK